MKNKIVVFLMLLLMPVANVFAFSKGTTVDTVTLNKCVDGDTARFMKNKNEIKVRFLAINTPESVHPTKEVEAYGKESSEYVCDLLTNAKKIQLEYDPNSDKQDKYGRYLAWVYIDGELLQDKLVKEGYAQVAYLYDDYLYTEQLEESQQEAKSQKIGIWSIEETVEEVNVDTESKIEEVDIMERILNFINEIFEKILSFIDELIEDVL